MDLPRTFTERKFCIEITCGFPLNRSFIQLRLLALNDNPDGYTKEFVKMYGQTYKTQVENWSGQAQEQLLKQALL